MIAVIAPEDGRVIAPEDLMRRAIAAARRGIAQGQMPFGCAAARGDQLLAEAHNTVDHDLDITAHAEVNALRAACRTAGEVHLPGVVVATTCAPCPMCLAALHWARVEVIYFGAALEDARAAGFHDLQIDAQQLLASQGSPTRLEGPLLREECRAVFEEWRARSDAGR